MNPLLKQFYNDEHMREAFKEFIVYNIKQYAIEKVMAKEDISGIADAHDIIIQSFIKLKENYGEQPKVIAKSSR